MNHSHLYLNHSHFYLNFDSLIKSPNTNKDDGRPIKLENIDRIVNFNFKTSTGPPIPPIVITTILSK